MRVFLCVSIFSVCWSQMSRFSAAFVWALGTDCRKEWLNTTAPRPGKETRGERGKQKSEMEDTVSSIHIWEVHRRVLHPSQRERTLPNPARMLLLPSNCLHPACLSLHPSPSVLHPLPPSHDPPPPPPTHLWPLFLAASPAQQFGPPTNTHRITHDVPSLVSLFVFITFFFSDSSFAPALHPLFVAAEEWQLYYSFTPETLQRKRAFLQSVPLTLVLLAVRRCGPPRSSSGGEEDTHWGGCLLSEVITEQLQLMSPR